MTVRFLVNVLGFQPGDVVVFAGAEDALDEIRLLVSGGLLELA